MSLEHIIDFDPDGNIKVAYLSTNGRFTEQKSSMPVLLSSADNEPCIYVEWKTNASTEVILDKGKHYFCIKAWSGNFD
jgi:hypothetical protein